MSTARKVTPLPAGHRKTIAACQECVSANLRAERTIKLHTQTANQLALAETQLVKAKWENRTLQAVNLALRKKNQELTDAAIEAIASIKTLGGNPAEIQDLIEREL